jgi:hypothetical protein
MAPPACISREYFLQEINEDGVSYWKCKFCTYAYKGEVYASLLSRKHFRRPCNELIMASAQVLNANSSSDSSDAASDSSDVEEA